MAFEIAQNRRSFNRARRIVNIAELLNVRLTALTVRSGLSGGGTEESLRFRINYKSRVFLTQKEGFSVQVRFNLTGSEGKKDSAKPLLELRCSFLLDYSLPPDSAAKPSEIRAFAKSNAVFNGWPYFREFVQSTCARLGLAPPPVPLLKFRVSAPRQEGQKEVERTRH